MDRMRPALQRLLARPSSLELLRTLVGSHTRAEGGKAQRRCAGGGAGVVRKSAMYGGYVSIGAAGTLEAEDIQEEEKTVDQANFQPSSSSSSKALSVPASSTTQPSVKNPLKLDKVYGQWHENLWSKEQLEYESSLDVATTGKRRLVETDAHRNDMHLWISLLHYRKRTHGHAGILSIFNAITQRGILVPTIGHVANAFWSAFLELGFRNSVALGMIIEYADMIWKSEKRRWSKLYAHIVRFFLENGEVQDAVSWHDQLFRKHPPGAMQFAEMCRHVVHSEGDLDALKIIYSKNEHRNIYSKVVLLLCQREDFGAALDWHFFLLENGDLPLSSKIVEPLIHHLAVYSPRDATRVTRSLVAAGVSFASSISKDLNDNTKISREIMNLIHGETLNIVPKKYNDELGARWFATRWISLDIAINGIHALGIQEIGPLSLQAIALRDPEPQSVRSRILQLERLGISLGSSLYARVIENFARRGDKEYLQGLLDSDQHPDALEDSALQERLIAGYVNNRDYTSLRRTLRIRGLASKSPKIEERNIELRALLTVGHPESVQQLLDQMREERTPVKSRTISHLIRHTLRPRRRGCRPMLVPGFKSSRKYNDINHCIKLLIDMMEYGNFVPVTYWREIIRRLGMLGRFDDLRTLVLHIVKWYKPGKQYAMSRSRYQVPSNIPTSHALHPLKIIFDITFQRAVVEWGFIWALRDGARDPDPRTGVIRPLDSTLPRLTDGIVLLRKLGQQGVVINSPTVRAAIVHRLVVYYGHGYSHRPGNRSAKMKMRGKLSMVIQQIDDALEGNYFSSIDVPALIERCAKIGMRRSLKAREKRLLKDPPSRKRLSRRDEAW